MAASASVVVALKVLFIALAVVVLAAFLWGFAMDGLASCVDLHARWFVVALINFYINLDVIGAWFVYKESSRIRAAVLVFLAILFGGNITCGYIIVQLFKLSPEESSNDPLFFVLARHQKGDVTGHKRGPSVVTSRIIISLLGCIMLGALICMLIVDGSPFRNQVFSPCMIGTLIDFYVNVVALLVWVAYKESSWISAFLWILSLICFGSIGTCVYVVRQLFYLSSQQHVSLVLFNNNNIDLTPSNPLLMEHANA